MQLKIFFFLASLSFFSACKKEVNQEVLIEKEIAQLNTIEKQQQFLENINDIDQEIRTRRPEASNKEMMDIDFKNLMSIEKYFEKYGYPTIKEHGKKACGTPALVIHHASGGVEPRARNFKIIYQAYTNGDIDDTLYTFYLNRWYDIKYGKRIAWDRPFRVEEELDTLYKALDLQSEIISIQNGLR